MQSFSFQNKRLYRSGSEDLSFLRPAFYSWSGAGSSSFHKESFGSTLAQMGLAGNVGNEKITMQILNERLASYLEKVKTLENTNSQLEIKIRQAVESRGPSTQDYSRYQATLDQLRNEIQIMIEINGQVGLQVDNAKLAADDYRVKYENELQIRQYVEADINALRKLLDDTNLARMHLEHEVEGLKVELIEIKKHHQIEVSELYSQVTTSGVHVDVDAPKGNDLAQIMEEIRAKYDKIVLKNQKELEAWHQSQISVVQVQVTENTAAIKEAKTEVSVSRRKMQTLEAQLHSAAGIRASLEENLQEVRMRYGMQVEQHNGIILQREAELGQLRNDIQSQTQSYQALLNIKMELEAEIATYRRLLDGESTSSKKEVSLTTITETIVDGKLVSSTKETKEIK